MTDAVVPPALVGRNLVLTGFMGTGKSTVGRIVAARLGWEHVDTDAVIVEGHGPIDVIFETDGEEAFRSLERTVAATLAERAGLVVSTGGRLLLDPVNAATLGASGPVLCLTAPIEEILARVVADGIEDRPLLRGDDARERVAALLAERAEAYAAFTQVDTAGRTPDEVADAVLDALTD